MKLIVSILAVVSFARAAEDYYGPPPSPPAHYKPAHYKVPMKYVRSIPKPNHYTHEQQYSSEQNVHAPQHSEEYNMAYQNNEESHQGYGQNFDNHNLNNHMYTDVTDFVGNDKNVNDFNEQYLPKADYAIQNVAPVGHAVEYAQPQVAYYKATPKILRSQFQTNGHAYEYKYHTENGIQAHEIGEIGKSSVVKGAYSYVGEDGKSYTVTYVADEHGYRPQGDHLPTPPPIPEEIVKSLEKNARDEANGIVDDGQYHHYNHQQKENTEKVAQEQDVTIVDQHGQYY